MKYLKNAFYFKLSILATLSAFTLHSNAKPMTPDNGNSIDQSTLVQSLLPNLSNDSQNKKALTETLEFLKQKALADNSHNEPQFVFLHLKSPQNTLRPIPDNGYILSSNQPPPMPLLTPDSADNMRTSDTTTYVLDYQPSTHEHTLYRYNDWEKNYSYKYTINEAQDASTGCQDGLLKFAYEDDTVLLGTVKGDQYSHVDVSEVLQQGDFDHEVDIYFIKGMPDYTKQPGGSANYTWFDQKEAYSNTAYVEEYMMQGSNLKYSIDMVSADKNQDKNQTTGLFVFNNYDKYQQYLESPEDGPSLSEFYTKALIGPYGRPEHSELNLVEKTDSSYQWITVNSPGDIRYKFEYDYVTKVSIDLSKYTPSCRVWESSKSCSQNIGSGEEWSVFAKIKPIHELGSHQTHMCLVMTP